MKVLIYSPAVLLDMAYGTDLELAVRHINQGDEVHFLACDTSLPFCEKNIRHESLKCRSCLQKRDNGLNLINLPEKNKHELHLERFLPLTKAVKFPVFENLEQLKKYTWNGVDIGSTAASTMITILREPRINIGNEFYRRFAEALLAVAIAIYEATIFWLREIKPDIFYLFNGRVVTRRPALRAAQKLGIKTYIHEKGGDLDTYMLTENTYPHDLEYIKKQIELTWEANSDFAAREKKASEWFIEKRRGIEQAKPSWIKGHQEGLLPQGFSKNKMNIAIYNSTEMEFESIDWSWQDTFYKNQNEAIRQILTSVPDENIHFYLRVHPHLREMKNSQTTGIKDLNYPNLTVIPADSPIHTYSLLDACDKVLTFRSTIGIEAAFWNKPSIVAGRIYYESLGSCYVPKTHDETVALLRDRGLKPLPVLGALKYGYWEKSKGIPFKYYSIGSAQQGKFKGVSL